MIVQEGRTVSPLKGGLMPQKITEMTGIVSSVYFMTLSKEEITDQEKLTFID